MENKSLIMEIIWSLDWCGGDSLPRLAGKPKSPAITEELCRTYQSIPKYKLRTKEIYDDNDRGKQGKINPV